MALVKLTVNGAAHEVEADPSEPLVYVLRNRLGLTGAKLGCGLEQCGACAVLADGKKVLSCVRAVSEFEGAEIITPEGLAVDGSAARIQRIFAEEGAAQCGYCTPGIVIAVTALLARDAAPERGNIVQALDGHLCRCGSHGRVFAAIERLVSEGDADGQS